MGRTDKQAPELNSFTCTNYKYRQTKVQNQNIRIKCIIAFSKLVYSHRLKKNKQISLDGSNNIIDDQKLKTIRALILLLDFLRWKILYVSCYTNSQAFWAAAILHNFCLFLENAENAFSFQIFKPSEFYTFLVYYNFLVAYFDVNNFLKKNNEWMGRKI